MARRNLEQRSGGLKKLRLGKAKGRHFFRPLDCELGAHHLHGLIGSGVSPPRVSRRAGEGTAHHALLVSRASSYPRQHETPRLM